MIRKWFFTLSESSINRAGHGWRGLIRVAVKSALAHTNLRPHLIYDGRENDFTDELKTMGVIIIHHRVSFFDELLVRSLQDPEYVSLCSAVFLRVELPLIEREDDYVLFSDCDVMFLKEPDLTAIFPTKFASAPQFNRLDYLSDINTGVMVMNLPALREDLPQFRKFIVDHLFDGWPGCDQENYRRFYNGAWDHLRIELNWKPYWGVSDQAQLVHWHGPKPRVIRDLLHNKRDSANAQFVKLFEMDKPSYAYYYQVWLKLAAGNRPTVIGNIDRLSNGVLSGWALNEDDLDDPVEITAFVDAIKVGVVSCQARRVDLQTIYKVDIGSFTLQFPPVLRDGKRHLLTLKDKLGYDVVLKFADGAKPAHEFCFEVDGAALDSD